MKLRLLGLLLLTVSFAFAQEQHVFTSKFLPKPDTVWVFKPKQFAESKKYPVLFLLHGYSGNYKQWNKIMDAQKYADQYNMVIVCPDGLFSSWYLNSPAKPNLQFETFFFDELFPTIKAKYSMNEEQVFISGLSMGGHGAMYLFLKHPELFKSAGSTSGGINLFDGFGKWGLAEVLGNPTKDSPLWTQYSVSTLIEGLKGSKKPFIFDCGSDDFFYQSNNALKVKCDELKLNATYISQPGGHNSTYWAKSIQQQLQFFNNLIK